MTSCNTSDNVCRFLQNWCYCFYQWHVFDVRLTDIFIGDMCLMSDWLIFLSVTCVWCQTDWYFYRWHVFDVRLTDIFQYQSQFIDTDFIMCLMSDWLIFFSIRVSLLILILSLVEIKWKMSKSQIKFVFRLNYYYRYQLEAHLSLHCSPGSCTAWDSTSLYFLREKKILHIPIDKQCPVVSANLYFWSTHKK